MTSAPLLSSYQQQLHQKIELTTGEFGALGVKNIEVFQSPESHYRMRAEFKIWHDGETVSYAMYRPGGYKQIYTVDSYPQGSARMQQLMPVLLKLLNERELLRNKLFQVEFLTSTVGDAVVTLLYHKPLGENWKQEALALAEQIGASIVGRSRKQKVIIGRDHVFEEFCVQGKIYRYQQIEGSFSQPNAAICEQMLNWISSNLHSGNQDLLELYCGNGNFTLPLAQNFREVLATEISKTSIQSAMLNCELNAIENISFIRMSSEDFTDALNRVRPFRRLEAVLLDDYDFSAAFVDPPRAGLDEKTRSLISRFTQIGYISCNPATLKRDLLDLTQTHEIGPMALFDQFPYTEHRECGVVLHKR